MDFQFAEDFKKLTVKCPPNHYKPQNKLVYRWVFDDITDERNFQPEYHKNPKRCLKFSDKDKCRSLALSFFISEVQAKNRFSEIKDTNGVKIYKTLGTMVAETNINEKDGVNSEPERTGHFSHHLVSGHEYESRFIIISKL